MATERHDAFLPDRALSLNNLASFISELGRREEALQHAQEAVDIRRQLATERPDAFLPELASSLNNLASLPAGNPEDYESLSWQVRILLSSAGGLVLGLLFYLSSPTVPRVGVIHVLERLAYHEGHLPFKNMLLQFFGGAIAIISGHSVGSARRRGRRLRGGL